MWVSVEKKVNLGNYQSKTYTAGFVCDVPKDEKTLDFIIEQLGLLDDRLESYIEDNLTEGE